MGSQAQASQLTVLRYENEAGNQVLLEFDAVVREDHAVISDITQKPIEDGGSLVDHIRRRPLLLSLEGILTNTPHIVPRRFAKGAQRIPVLPTLQFTAPFNRVHDGYKELERLESQAVQIEILTDLRDYTGMVLQSISTSRTATSGDAATFTLTFQEVRKVETSLGEQRTPSELRANKTRDKGPGATSATNTAQRDALLRTAKSVALYSFTR